MQKNPYEGNISKISKVLNISRPTIYKWKNEIEKETIEETLEFLSFSSSAFERVKEILGFDNETDLKKVVSLMRNTEKFLPLNPLVLKELIEFVDEKRDEESQY